MAFTPFPNARLLGFQAQGDVAGFTLYTSQRGQIVWFPQSPPKEPPSWRQLHFRGLFDAAAAYWKLLTQQQRNDWERASKRASLGIGGYALYVYRFTKHQPGIINTISRQTHITLIYNGP
jgi:hypothetical protein